VTTRRAILIPLAVAGVVAVLLLAIRSASGGRPTEPQSPGGSPNEVERVEQPRPGPDAPGVNPSAKPMPKGGP
jgi:hypothetical protein